MVDFARALRHGMLTHRQREWTRLLSQIEPIIRAKSFYPSVKEAWVCGELIHGTYPELKERAEAELVKIDAKLEALGWTGE